MSYRPRDLVTSIAQTIINQNTIDSLSDVTTSSLSAGDYLIYNGVNWSNARSGQRFFGSNSTTLQTLGTTFTGLLIYNEYFKDPIYTHTTNSPTVTVNDDGVFRITAEVTIGIVSGNSRSGSRIRFTQNGLEIPGCRAGLYHRQSTEDETCATITALVNVTSGDAFEIQAARFSGSATLVTAENAVRLMIEKV